KEAKKPFYALTESYKFVRLYPLSQYDLPSAKPGLTTFQNNNDRDWRRQLEAENPILDYTPPEYITFLFTNLGVMTPSGVSDELIKFYY
ncbi:translation initiation factor eIF-2B subunit alpha, partial [Spiromyces aspiralis]